MKRYSKEYPMDKMAKILGVCQSGYYNFLKRLPSKREKENKELIKEIKNIHTGKWCVYGSPRVQQELARRGKKGSRKRVARLMKRERNTVQDKKKVEGDHKEQSESRSSSQLFRSKLFNR
ncbi:MAG: IS3 family transposase [Verrucomicrobia bacterium]|nr:IS3 family transposase [Verrucomicrobiota bacterium]